MANFIQVSDPMCWRRRWDDVATKLTHPNEWKQFLMMCDRQEFDNPLFEHYRNMFFADYMVALGIAYEEERARINGR